MLEQNVKNSLRFIGRQKLFAVLVILTLALGLGVNTAVYGILDSVLFQALPFADPAGLVVLWSQSTEPGGSEKDGVGPSEYRDWSQGTSIFTDLAAVRYQGYSLVEEGDPTELLAAEVTPDFFDILGVSAVVGRTFDGDEVRSGDEKVVLISQSLWETRFGGDRDLPGRTLRLEDEPYTVLGVLPRSFRFPNDDVQIWAPMVIGAGGSKARNLHLLGRLADGVSVNQARSEMQRLSDHLAEEKPGYYSGRRALVIPIQEQLVGHLRPLLLVLSGSVLAILAICCVNLANLFLARTLARRDELFVRTALGAGRGQIFRQLLFESLTLAFFACAVGSAISFLVGRALIRLSPVHLPSHVSAALGLDSLIFIVTAALVTGLAIGILPAIQGSKQSLATSLRSAGRGSHSSRSGGVTRQIFVTSQIAISLILLVGAGLMIRSVVRLGQVEPGWNPNQLLGAQIYLSEQHYGEAHERVQMVEELLAGLKQSPQVASAAVSTSLPGTEVGIDFALPITLLGSASDPNRRASLRSISPGYFKTLGVPLIQGRDFTDTDTADSRRVVIVNQTFVRRYLPDRAQVVGQWVSIPFRGLRDWEIVGVVGDIRHQGLDQSAQAEFFLPFSQAPFGGFGVAARSAREADDLAPVLRSALWSIDSRQPISWMESMDRVVADSFKDRRFVMLLLSTLGGIALLLTGIGIYGVVSFSVQSRISEIGVRMALGAQPQEVSQSVMAQALKLAVVGLGIGVVCALVTARWLQSFLFGVTASDPLVFLSAPAVLMLIALAAAFLPAWKATRIDPVTALRTDSL